MVFKLRIFSSEVTRVSLEVGTKGQLGGQAVVLGVEGTWKELVRSRSPWLVLLIELEVELGREGGCEGLILFARRRRTSTGWRRTLPIK
jgi:hypothetical protein